MKFDLNPLKLLKYVILFFLLEEFLMHFWNDECNNKSFSELKNDHRGIERIV